MLIVVAVLSTLTGVALAIMAVILIVRGTASRPTGRFTQRTLGAITLLMAGCLLAGGAQYRLVRRLSDPTQHPDALETFHRTLEEPLNAIQLLVDGPDPFGDPLDPCSLRLHVVLIRTDLDRAGTILFQPGASLSSTIPRSWMSASETPRPGSMAYVISWQSILAGVTTAEERPLAQFLGHIADWRIVYRVEAEIVGQRAVGERLPPVVMIAANQHPAMVLFTGTKAGAGDILQGTEWVSAYHDNYSPRDRIDLAEWAEMRTLDEFTSRLVPIHVAGVLLLVTGLSLLLLRRDRAAMENEPAAARTTLPPLLPTCVPEALVPPRAGIRPNHVIVMTVLALGLFANLFGEKIPLESGFGLDGQHYGSWALHFNKFVVAERKDARLDTYFIQRILPSAVVHYSLRFCAIPLTHLNVVYAFGLLNTAVLALTAFVWCQIAKTLRVSERGKWLGVIALFVNDPVLRMSTYHPVLTDIAAFGISMLMLHCYLKGRRLALCLLTALGAFDFPVLIFEGGLLLLFPRDRLQDETCFPAPRWRSTLIAAALASVVFLFITYQVMTGPPSWPPRSDGTLLNFLKLRPATLGARASELIEFIGLGAVISAVYIFLAMRRLSDCDRFLNLSYLWQRLRTPAFLTGLVFIVLVRRAVFWCSSGSPPSDPIVPGGIMDALARVAHETVRRPGIFAVSHAEFYGPIVFIAFLAWAAVCRLIHRHGLGLTLAVTFGILLSLESESRKTITFYALIVPFVVQAMDAVGLRLSACWLFAILSFVFSKIWIVIGLSAPDFTSYVAANLTNITEPRAQRFWGSFGTYMSWQTYFVQAGAVLLAGGLLYGLFRRRTRQAIWPGVLRSVE
jgi:hypothetical protein